MIASSLSRRYGVAVRPSHRRVARLLHARRERDGGKVVALVDDDEPVAFEDDRSIVAAGEALDHRDVDDAGRLVLAAADLADLLRLQTEVFGET